MGLLAQAKQKRQKNQQSGGLLSRAKGSQTRISSVSPEIEAAQPIDLSGPTLRPTQGEPAPRAGHFIFSPTATTEPRERQETARTTPQQTERRGPLGIVEDIGQGVGRVALGGLAGVKALTEPDSPTSPRERARAFVEAEVDPQRLGKAGEIITGRTEPFTLRQEGEETGEAGASLARLVGFDISEEEAESFSKRWGGVIGFSLPFVDWTPIGRGARSVSKIAQNVLRSRTPEETAEQLTRFGISEDVARREADELVRLSDQAELETRIGRLADEQNVVAAEGAARKIAGTTDQAEIQKALEEVGVRRSQARRQAQELAEETDPTAIVRKIAPESTQRLEAEGVIRAGDTARATDDISEQLVRTADELKKIQKGEKIENPLGEIPIGNNVSITRQSLKHIVERRGDDVESIIRAIPEILRNPTKIADNSAKRQGSFLYVKKNGKAKATVLEVTKTPDGSHRVVSAFPMDEKTFRKLEDVSGRPDVPPLDISPVESGISTAQRSPSSRISQQQDLSRGREEVAGAPRAQQRAGTRIVTPEGRRLVETDQELVEEAGFASQREIEDLVRVPVKTSEDVPSMQKAAQDEGFDTRSKMINGVEVGDLAGQSFFPNSSRIKELQREINQIRGQRLQGNIDGKEANKQVAEINKEIEELAKKAGVAMRTMSDGSQRPAIRKSGIYAEKEWETQPLKNARGLLGGQSYNLRDFFITLDGITAREAGERGGWGIGTHLQYSVRQADGAKDTFGVYHGQRIRHALENRNLKANTQTGQQLNLALWNIDRGLLQAGKIDEAVDDVIRRLEVNEATAGKARKDLIKAARAGIPDEVFDAATDIRQVLDELREQANVVRKEMGKPAIGFVENYGPLLQSQSFWRKMMGSRKTKITDNFDFIIPNAKKNPHAIKREGGMGEFETNALTTLSRYVDNISNDIFIAPQIEKLKVVKEVIKGRGFDSEAGKIDRFIRENIVGQPGPISSILGFKQGTKQLTAVEKTIQARSVAALAGNPVWTVFVQPASVATLTIPRAGGLTHGMQNYLSGFFDFVTNKKLRKRVKNRPTMVSKTKGASVGMTGAGDMNQLAGKIQKGKIDSYNAFVGKLSDANEYWLTSSSMMAGYREGAKLGLKGRDLDIYADWMGGATQSEYTRLARPLMLNEPLARLGAPFQTFAFEFYRYAKTLAGQPGGMPLEKSQRLNQALMLMAGIYVYNQYSEATTGRTLTTPGSAIPLVGGFADEMINEGKKSLGFKGEEQTGHGRSPIAPAEDVRNVIGSVGALELSNLWRRGLEEFVENANVVPLKTELVKWGMGFSGLAGASAVNRFVDGMIADVRGAQLTRSGEFAFPVTGSDKFIAPIMGPWSTSAGKQYLNQQAESEKQKAQVRPIFNEVQDLVAAGKEEQAQAIVDSLRGEEWETYKKIRAVERARRTEEMKVEMLPVYQEAKKLVEQGKEAEAQEMINNLSEEEYRVYELIRDQNRKFEDAENGEIPIWGDGEIDDASHIVEIVRVYAQAIGTDPVSAFQAMFTKEKLRKLEGDAVIFQRAELQETQQERVRQAQEEGLDLDSLSEMRLDHTIPLQLGGSNSKDNLTLIPVEQHAAYTPVENHLGRLLRDGSIKRKEAQQLIVDFKQGRITAQEVLDR